MINDLDMNPEKGGADPRKGVSSVNTGNSEEAIDMNQPDPVVEAPLDTSIIDNGVGPIAVDKSLKDSSQDSTEKQKLENVRRGLGFDMKGNFALNPATAGGAPLSEDDSKSKYILNAQVPGRRAGGRGGLGPTTGGRRNPLGGIRGGIAAAVTTAGLVLGGVATYIANQSSANTGDSPRGVPTRPVSPEGTSTPAPATETIAPIPTETSEPTPAPGERGKYTSVEELPFSEEKKNAIETLTKDCTPFIITDNGMIVIENAHIAGSSTVNYDGKEIPVSRLHSIRLNTSKYPDAVEKFDKALDSAKFEAWKKQSNQNNATLEEYIASKSTVSHPFEVFGYDGISNNLSDRKLDDDTFIIIKILAEEDRANILWSVQSEFQNEVIGDVLARGVFINNITGIGTVNRNGDVIKYGIGANLAVPLASLGGELIGNKITTKLSMANEAPTLVPVISKIREVLVPGYTNPPPDSTKDLESIFTITGTKIGN